MENYSALNEKEQEVQEMIKAGLHIGHQKSRGNPKMKPFILMVKNGIQIINTEKTYDNLKVALDFIYKAVMDNKVILLLGTSPSAQESIVSIAKECDLPYVSNRWIGGIMTNYQVISKRIDSYLNLENKKNTGALEKYTKKERLRMTQLLEKLEIKFGGVKNLKRIPDIIFIVDVKKHKIAVDEAISKKIDMVAVVDSDADPSNIKYVIPANDNARIAINYILGKLKDTILEAKKQKMVEAGKIKPQ